MVARLVPVVLAACLLVGCGADDSEEGAGDVAASVAEQLRYLDPQSSTVVAVDLRWAGGELKSLRAPFLERVLPALLGDEER